MTATGDYTRQIPIGATPEKVFDTLTTAAQFASWWAPATGSAAEASKLSITFDSFPTGTPPMCGSMCLLSSQR